MARAYLIDEHTGRKYVMQDCSIKQVLAAIEGHPGPLEPNEININQPAERVFIDSIGAAQRNSELLMTSLLIRLIALRWHERKSAKQIASVLHALEVPDLLRPQSSMRIEINGFVAAFDRFDERLVELLNGPQGSLSDAGKELLKAVGDSRSIMRNLQQGIQQVGALKCLHDALHNLQVYTDVNQRNRTLLQPTLKVLVDKTIDAISRPQSELGADGTECLKRIHDVLLKTRQLLAQSGEGNVVMAMHCLRRLFCNEMRELDRLLFAAVSDWPLRPLVLLMVKAEQVGFTFDHQIAVSLHNELLRQILAHSVWQDVDFRLYAIEEAIRRGHPNWFSEVDQESRNVWDLVNCLEVVADTDQKLPADLRVAVINYEDRQGPDGIKAIRDAAAGLASKVRQRFLEVDTRLKGDFGRFQPLVETLRSLADKLSRVV
ncbi:hypothetical protein [Paracoccus versutus]|uniref:hypothetical protein n=1 Tax=Paracoccus versutus TaxID=34007 RepID=UPI000DF76DD0|nr:hypothetical protein [Paracoccus versutus]RDD68376.1 hypothetical protein DVR11_27190 [Paracoccus versutus]